MVSYRVTSVSLNMRHSPTGAANDNLFQPPLAQGEIVEQVETSADGKWFRVQVKQGKITREGWVSARYLAPADAPQGFMGFQPPANEPAWMVIAEREIGVGKDRPDNARIGEYLASVTDNLTPEQQFGDKIDRSSAFVNWCLTHAGYTGTNSMSARSWWDSWRGGVKSDEAQYGALAVFRTLRDGIDKGQGFVGFFVKAEGSKIHVLGGHNKGGVDILPHPRKDLIGYIYPHALPSIIAPANEDEEAAPIQEAPLLTRLPSGRFAEASLEDHQKHIDQLEAELTDGNAETPEQRAQIEQQISDAQAEYTQALARSRYSAPLPIPDATDADPNPNWKKAWGWTTADFKGRTIADPNAPFNDANHRNKPGEAQGSNIERVIAFLDVEHNPRYSRQGDSTFCTVFVYDSTWLLSVEIPIAPNRAANNMCNWLEGTIGQSRGWSKLSSIREAQDYANRGFVVIATQRRKIAGHVALVRPVPLNKTPLENDAYTAQAGATNSSQTTVATIFGDPATVTFYMHP